MQLLYTLLGSGFIKAKQKVYTALFCDTHILKEESFILQRQRDFTSSPKQFHHFYSSLKFNAKEAYLFTVTCHLGHIVHLLDKVALDIYVYLS